jgi:hypothetical protein
MKAWIVGSLILLALSPGTEAQLVEVHAGVRLSNRAAVEVHYGYPRYQSGVFVPAPVRPMHAYRYARLQRHTKAYRRAMLAYERALRKFEHEHRQAHRLGIPHAHVRGGIVYHNHRRQRHHRNTYRWHR